MNKFFVNFLLAASLAVLFSSCRVFVTNRMFKTAKEYRVDSIQQKITSAERNYTIQKNDYISLKVYSHGGERIIDPDYELSKSQVYQLPQAEPTRYLVKVDGYASLPMIGDTYVAGYTLNQTDSILAIAYTKYYKNPFVITRLENKRVVVIGPTGGKVIPLTNDNMNLIEVIALYGGIDEYGKAYNIRIIRGDLKNPDVSIVDLSTIEGMKRANLAVLQNDIIYIESSRRFLTTTLRDISPVISLMTSIILTIVLITR